jgi:hypothetical protein
VSTKFGPNVNVGLTGLLVAVENAVECLEDAVAIKQAHPLFYQNLKDDLMQTLTRVHTVHRLFEKREKGNRQ